MNEDEVFAASAAVIKDNPIQRIDVRSPKGTKATLCYRDGTTDLSVIGSTWELWGKLVDEYALGAMPVFRGVFVDVGAHVGSVAIAVLLDNPKATAILVEPIPENIEMIRANLAAAGVADRATIIEGAVGTDAISYNHTGSETATFNRFIGNLNIDGTSERLQVRRIPLADLLPADAMKIDCEGGEWGLFADPAITSIPFVFGEYHGDPGAAGVRATFDQTHDLAFSDESAPTGNFRAVAR